MQSFPAKTILDTDLPNFFTIQCTYDYIHGDFTYNVTYRHSLVYMSTGWSSYQITNQLTLTTLAAMHYLQLLPSTWALCPQS